MAQVVIVGIGQSLRGDDAIGLRVVQFWQESFPDLAQDPQVRIELLELPGLSLLTALEGVDRALLVDAVRSGAKAGQIHHLTEADLDTFGAGSGTAHGWGVAEMLVLGRKFYPQMLPRQIDILGIEAGEVYMGEQLSQPVADALDQASAFIAQWIRAARLSPPVIQAPSAPRRAPGFLQ